MNKIIISTLILIISACSSSDSGDSIAPSSVPAGIYSGTITPTGGTPDRAIALITSNGNAAIVDIDTIESFIGRISASSFTGTLYSTTTVPATGQVTIISNNVFSGTYSSSIGGGTFAMLADPNLYNRPSSLSKLVGTWIDSVFTNITGTTTWVIQSDGSFTVASTASCTGTGNFSVFNPSDNEYNLTLNIANCPDFNGTYSGFAVLSDTTFTEDTLSLIFSNGTNGGILEPIKQ